MSLNTGPDWKTGFGSHVYTWDSWHRSRQDALNRAAFIRGIRPFHARIDKVADGWAVYWRGVPAYKDLPSSAQECEPQMTPAIPR